MFCTSNCEIYMCTFRYFYILTVLDNNKIDVLIMLDCSKAFDTINHALIAILQFLGFGDDFKYVFFLSQRQSTAGEERC